MDRLCCDSIYLKHLDRSIFSKSNEIYNRQQKVNHTKYNLKKGV